MNLLWWMSLSFQITVILNTWVDSIYIIKKKTTPSHGLEWVVTACVCTIAGMGWRFDVLSVAQFDFLMLPITWIIGDISLNLFLGENPITYLGSGEWDKFFKFHWPKNAAKAMWLTKLILLAIASWVFHF